MMRKRNLLISICLSAVMLFFCSEGINKTIKKEPLVFTASLGEWKHSKDGYYANAKTVFTNNTRDTFELVTMSCFPENGCSTDSKTIHVWFGDCLKNIPLFIKIPPHDNYVREIELTREDSVKNVDGIFRISVDIRPATYSSISNRKRRRLISEFVPKSYLGTTKDTMSHLYPKSYVFDMLNFHRYQPLDTDVETITLWSSPIKTN